MTINGVIRLRLDTECKHLASLDALVLIDS